MSRFSAAVCVRKSQKTIFLSVLSSSNSDIRERMVDYLSNILFSVFYVLKRENFFSKELANVIKIDVIQLAWLI
jgi:hypothetical protein